MNLNYVENSRGGRFVTSRMETGKDSRELVAAVTKWLLDNSCLFVAYPVPEEVKQLCDNWLRKFPDVPLSGHKDIDWIIFGKPCVMVLYRSDLISGNEAVTWAGGQVVN